MNPGNARRLCLTAAAGTELAVAYSRSTVIDQVDWPYSSPGKGVYNPKAFILHAVSLRQTFVHCGRFPTAASRRSQGRVSVPMWGVALARPLPVKASVSRYLINKMIGRSPLRTCRVDFHPNLL